MKKINLINAGFVALVFLALVFSSSSGGRAGQANAGNTGAPGENGTVCGNCHSANSFGTCTETVTFTDLSTGAVSTTYTPGNTYQVTLTVNTTGATAPFFGFQMTDLKSDNTNAGTWSNVGSNVQLETVNSLGGRAYVEHGGGSSPSNTFTMNWTAPSTDVGAITFYHVGNAVNGTGTTGGDSGSMGATTVLQAAAPSSCEVPTGVSAVALSGNAIRVAWTNPTGGERFRLRYRTVGGSWVEGLTQADEPFKFFNGLSPNTMYEYQIKSLCATTNSAWSSTFSVMTVSDICDLPSSGNAIIESGTTVTFEWAPTPDDQKYKFKYKPSSGSFPWVEYTSVTTNFKTETGLTPNTEYKYKMKTKCSGGWTQWTTNYFVTTPSSNFDEGTNAKIANEQDVKIFPNPVSQNLNFSSGIEYTDYQISDIQGRLITTGNINETTVDVSNLNKGMYIISFIKDDTVVSKRFVKE